MDTPSRRGGRPSGHSISLARSTSSRRSSTDTRRRDRSPLGPRVSFYVRPPGLRDPTIHLMFVLLRVLLAIAADVIVLSTAAPDHFNLEVKALRGDWLLFAAVFNALAGLLTTYYQVLTSRCFSVFVFWLALRFLWREISDTSLHLDLPPHDFSLQITSLLVSSFCLSQSLYYSDRVWTENDDDYVDYPDAVERMDLSQGM
ncbi:hypothetical protein LSAT2_014894 [Lamellibrachia satsuma]|nr:hypothetical protein LSAT2_014894 [Lamellibrachia satsuma]